MIDVLRKVGSAALSAAKKSFEQAKDLSIKLGYNVPNGKTVASDGATNTLSGWSTIKEGAEYFNRTATPQDVINKSGEIGHTLRPAGAADNGISGQFNASHAEKQLSLLSNKPIGVSSAMCDDCIEYFRKLAMHLNVEKIVCDPNKIRIFNPNGTITEILY